MPWVVLVISGCLEAVWATALAASNGFRNLVPSVIFLLALAASMSGLAWAIKTVPVGTGYAVWVGIGAVTTFGCAMAVGGETLTVAKALCIGMIVAGVVGLKLAH